MPPFPKDDETLGEDSDLEEEATSREGTGIIAKAFRIDI